MESQFTNIYPQINSKKLSLNKKFMVSLLVSFFAFNPQLSMASSVSLPISTITPGAINLTVTQSNIESTICVSGYTKTIRPPASYTTNLKKNQLANSYARYGSTDTSLFEEDHLIPLELGGNPTDPKNLWPEPWSGDSNARIKDKLENALHALVCNGALSLKSAQKAIATNWYTAYLQYVLHQSPSQQPEPVTTVSTTPLTSPAAPDKTTSAMAPTGATGRCKDGTYSFAATHSGMCSRHGGVAEFYP